MNALSIRSWLITLFIVILILGLRRIVWPSRITALLFSVQPANTRREAAYIHDSLPQILKIWKWRVALFLMLVVIGLAIY